MGQKYILKKWSKNGFGWAKNTYTKKCQKMVTGCPEGYAVDILEKWPEAIETLFKHHFLNMSMAYPSGQPATIF